MRSYLFGNGWWTLWHLFIWGTALPLAGLIWWLWIYKPGKGPQGGEFAAGMLILFLLAWTLIGFVEVMLLAAPAPGGFGRFMKAGLLWLLGWSLIGWALYWLTNLSASESASTPIRRLALAGFLGLTVALYGASFELLARMHRR
jgi:hypothetical protein